MQSFLENRPRLDYSTDLNGNPLVTAGLGSFIRKPAAKPDSNLAVGKSSAPAEAEPKIEMINRDGAIEKIVITCACCRKIELRCEY